MNNAELTQIARTQGTPLYVFDQRVLKQRIEFLRSCLPDGVKLCYAVKANTFIIPLVLDSVSSLEACSTGEARICIEAGAAPQMLVISGVNKDAAYMEELIGGNVPVHRYTVESRLQFDMLLGLARKYNVRIPLLLRMTSGNQFGLDKSELVSIVRDYAASPNVEICGLQYFSGTQKTSLKRLARELRSVSKMIAKLREEYSFECGELEFGPGFPVQYFEEEPFDEREFIEQFGQMLADLEFAGPITLELGRSIAASCGTFLTSVVDAKLNDGQRYAIVDGGMNHLVYYGQSLAMRQPKCQIIGTLVQESAPESAGECTAKSAPEGTAKSEVKNAEEPATPEPASGASDTSEALWNICGSLCSVNDILAKQLPLPNLQIGSVLVFENTGAYCMTEGISLFLSRDLPKVCLVDGEGNAQLVRQGVETYPLNAPHRC